MVVVRRRILLLGQQLFEPGLVVETEDDGQIELHRAVGAHRRAELCKVSRMIALDCTGQDAASQATED
jgi:hypothetical protein